MEECFRCDRDAVQECPRCGALYCEEHGDVLCERCQDPALALPSYRVFRGSLIALLAGTAFAVWLLVRPTAITDADGPVPLTSVFPTATATATAGPQGVEPVIDTSTPTPTPTPAVIPEITPTPEPPPVRVHTVAAGDTLLAIASQYLPAGKVLSDYTDELAAFNGITDQSAIVIGQEIQIPPQ